MPTEFVALEHTVFSHDGIRVYEASHACMRYLQLIRRDKNRKKANEFLNDLVLLESRLESSITRYND